MYSKIFQGVTTYFSSNCTLEDSKIVNEFLTKNNMEAYNSRVFKTTENGNDVYEVSVMSYLLILCHFLG